MYLHSNNNIRHTPWIVPGQIHTGKPPPGACNQWQSSRYRGADNLSRSLQLTTPLRFKAQNATAQHPQLCCSMHGPGEGHALASHVHPLLCCSVHGPREGHAPASHESHPLAKRSGSLFSWGQYSQRDSCDVILHTVHIYIPVPIFC